MEYKQTHGLDLDLELHVDGHRAPALKILASYMILMLL